ncbi:response regulator [Marivirga salinae]|uniref:Response regulator n=1 Tax=Marivirga salinarum TaxID=3059078 RepID=A0AA51N8Q0_9BACT|nr:response regulator [Marivirga sp. BDSF4-3]WMN10744.1 response regulator [Marivirga sp. BDSF4-3]
MKKKLNYVLLVDDDEATNYLNKMIIEERGCAEEIIIVENGLEALKFLTNKRNGKFPQPDLIFLDINMPLMDGWEFLEEYKKLEENQKSKVIIVMLTTSINPDDKEKAHNHQEIQNYENKPLDEQKLERVLKEYFPDHI